MLRKLLLLFAIVMSLPSGVSAQYQERKESARGHQPSFCRDCGYAPYAVNDGWRFMLVTDSSRTTDTDFAAPGLDDSSWRTVDLPHDFQFGLPWIEQGSKARGFKPMAEGWYRKSFRADPSWRGLDVALDFGGLMYYGDVYLNGHKVASTDYGLCRFRGSAVALSRL